MLEIRFEGDRDHFAPGETLSGTVEWSFIEDAGEASLHLFWHTEGVGTKDAEVIDTQPYQQIGRSGRRSFEFKLPMSPYSYSGKLISILWEIEFVVTDVDEVGHKKFTLLPKIDDSIIGKEGWKPKELF